MKGNKPALLILLNLILLFVVMIVAFLALTGGADKSRLDKLESNVKELSQKVDGIIVRTDEWDQIINGAADIDMSIDEEEVDENKENPEPEKKDENIEENTEKNQPEQVDGGEEEPVEVTNNEKSMKVNASVLNMRGTPSSKGSVVKELKSGESVKTTGKEEESGGYNWVEVKTQDGKTGWVAKQFLK